MGLLTQLVFRYRGTMDFNRFFKESKAFYTDRKFDLVEKVYKSKADEIEGSWEAVWRVDMYTKIIYELEYKVIDVKFITEERGGKRVPMVEGKIRVVIRTSAEENYGETGIAGKKEIFPKRINKKTGAHGESWLHKIYNKVTFRDREEGTYGEAILIAHQYIDMLKSIFGAEARY
jgi:hypothetical protein